MVATIVTARRNGTLSALARPSGRNGYLPLMRQATGVYMATTTTTNLVRETDKHDVLIASMGLQDCFAVRSTSDASSAVFAGYAEEYETEHIPEWYYIDRRELDNLAETCEYDNLVMAWHNGIVHPE